MKIDKFYSYIQLARLHSLFGAWLLLLPSFWSLAINYRGSEHSIFTLIYYYLIFFIGSISMRAFGCIVNDMVDVKIDRLVERTKNRPLASKEVNFKEAFCLLLGFGGFSGLLLLSFNWYAIGVTLISLIFVIAYPFAKRYISSPQLILGITFNWGILVADAVLNESISFNSILLYIASIFWTMAYDTIYAYQDYNDDIANNIKSMAVLIGDNPHKIISVMYIVMGILLMMLAIINEFGVYFYLIGLILFLILLFNLRYLNHKEPEACSKFFKLNVGFGFVLWIGFLLA